MLLIPPPPPAAAAAAAAAFAWKTLSILSFSFIWFTDTLVIFPLPLGEGNSDSQRAEGRSLSPPGTNTYPPLVG